MAATVRAQSPKEHERKDAPEWAAGELVAVFSDSAVAAVGVGVGGGEGMLDEVLVRASEVEPWPIGKLLTTGVPFLIAFWYQG